jgi:GT2 family glycosyltransferase
MTCYNRRNSTLKCLELLFNQRYCENYQVDVVLVDDGSSDGTSEALQRIYPNVKILHGDGTLFWCGGMRLAYGEALKNKSDFYLWLNDDSFLFINAISKLIETYQALYQETGKENIIVGSLCDPQSKRLTYGGSNFGPWWNPTHYTMINPGPRPQPCDLFNGNCVLIPYSAALRIGNMSANYQHGPGDKDYALRASAIGINSWITDGYIGTCKKNDLIDGWKRKDLPMKERIAYLKHPVVMARVNDWIVFSKKYHKLLWPYYLVSTLFRNAFPSLYIYLKSSL